MHAQVEVREIVPKKAGVALRRVMLAATLIALGLVAPPSEHAGVLAPQPQQLGRLPRRSSPDASPSQAHTEADQRSGGGHGDSRQQGPHRRARRRRSARDVSPFVGSRGTGHTTPGAKLPFSMIYLAPLSDKDPEDQWQTGPHMVHTTPTPCAFHS